MLLIKQIVQVGIFLGFTACNAMEHDAYMKELLSVAKPWIEKIQEAVENVQESAAMQAPKTISESDNITAIFDAYEERVTLYEPFKCYSLSLDYFFHCLELLQITSETSNKMSLVDKKRCCLQ